ncbi:MAG TPA: hypothetical protein VG816_08540 [Solirubrobacterales bacterium]|nr:hypothetical protein [Solirubrobacterales bacterium]
MSPRRTWIALLPAAALLLAGCGGGGGDESSESTATTTAAPAALTKAELIEQGDAICGEVNAAVGGEASGEEGSGATTQVAGLYSGMVASLNNLGAPQETAGYAEFSEAAEELATAEGEVKLAAEREDTAALETAESNASTALTSFQNAASEYGFKDCSEGPSAPTATTPGGETGEAEAGGEEPEAVAPETVEPEVEPEPVPEEVAPETGGAGGAPEGGGSGAPEAGGGSGGGSSGGIGPG